MAPLATTSAAATADLAALPAGPALPDYPYLVKAPGTAPVYLLDAPL